MKRPPMISRGTLSTVMTAVLLAGVAGSLGAAENAAKTVSIDPAHSQGIWEGWGISLCWWAKIFGDRDDLADVLFTKNDVAFEGHSLPGLGLNIVRYNAGACSWNEVDGRKMAVSKTILPFRQIEGFWIDGKNPDPASKSWDWSVDANQRAMLAKARDRGADRFELFSNAPMWWMCRNGNPSGGKSKAEDNLAPEHYDQFAIYLATIARQARENWGITFTTVEPFNEPISGYWTEDCKQEGCYFSPASQAAILPRLRAALDEAGLRGMSIAASDETSYTQALKVWNSYPPEAKALVSQVNVHGYEGTKGPRTELRLAVAKDKKRLWNSEHGDKFGDGVHMTRTLLLDLQQLHPMAWCYWQALDGGNQGGWGLISADLAEKTIGQVNPKYFMLAQFTRHIRPGMTLLETGERDVAAAYDAKTRTLVVVVFNDGPSRSWEFDLSRFASVEGPVSGWSTEPAGTARYESRSGSKLSGRRLSVSLPTNSLQTFEIQNVRP